MTSREDQAVYDAQDVAFAGTPLADRTDRTSLIREAIEICEHPWLMPFVGSVDVDEASVRLTSAAAYAQGQRIRFAPNVMARFVAAHEVAHVITARCMVQPESSHGPLFRAIYAELVAVVYGDQYGLLLRHAFSELALPVSPAILPRRERPIIDLDVLADASREIRWL